MPFIRITNSDQHARFQGRNLLIQTADNRAEVGGGTKS